MNKTDFVLDIDGKEVRIGDFVEVLEIDKVIERRLSEDEKTQVHSMVGDVLEVEDIDEYGCVWVSKEFPTNDHTHFSHGIALEKEQMRLKQGNAS
jgi:hypothetical protein